jgi:hypothetical protein
MSVDVHPLFVDLCDDAAVFPPGNVPLTDAVPAHVWHQGSAHAPLVGPFVVAAKDLDRLAPLVAHLEPRTFRLLLTVPLAQLAAAVAYVDQMDPVHVEALEIALPDEVAAAQVVPAVERAVDGRRVPAFVELPRDARRQEIVEALSRTDFMAKLRTGGVRADLHPDGKELASAVASLVAEGVPFKATAGLHHAVRNTDPDTGFEQHGFLNVLAATGAALDGAGESRLLTLLADRDAARVADHVRALPPTVRQAFRSFGTCSIAEPVEELTGLGLLDTTLTKDLS